MIRANEIDSPADVIAFGGKAANGSGHSLSEVGKAQSTKQESDISFEESVVRTVSRLLFSRITSRFGKGTEFTGEYRTSEANVGVEIAGDLQSVFSLSDGSMIVLKESSVAKNTSIACSSIVVAGEYDGEITAETVEVLSTAKVSGAIKCRVLDIHAGANVRATISME